MPRQKAYSRDQFLGQAVELFWDSGFEATSIQDIVNHTGLNKRSMYDEFGSKKKLYGHVLQHYFKKNINELALILSNAPLGLENLKNFFESVGNLENDRGCLIVNSLAEKNSIGGDNQKICQELLEETEDRFYQNLLAAKNDPSQSLQLEPRSTAYYLRVLLQGLSIEFKQNSESSNTSSVVKMALQTLK